MTTAGLTPKQQKFVQEYLIDLNASRSAVRAGYSQRNADKIGPELLGKTRVARAIQEAQQHQSERTQITADLVLQGLLTEARGWGKDTSPAARIAAWAHLGRHLGMFKDKVEVENSQDELFREILTFIKARRATQLTNGNGHIEITNGHA